MRGYLFGILVLLKYCICQDAHDFDGDVKDFVVGNRKLYVLTDRRLHQMRHDLFVEKSKDITNATHPNTVTILVPFDANGTLITCGTSNSEYCEVLDINITNRIYWEGVSVGPQRNETSVAFIVDINPQVNPMGTYLLIARKKRNSIATLRDTLNSGKGGIFSQIDELSDSFIKTTRTHVEFVDGFQVSSRNLSYLFLNTETETERKVHVLRLKNSIGRKTDIFKDLKGATIECCDDKVRPVLLASTIIPSGKSVIWAGVFSAQNERDPENTALALYDISHVEGKVKGFCHNSEMCLYESGVKLQPRAVVFKYSWMTSVAAVRSESWIVLFIGTKDGQLIKLVLGETFKASCPMVLYKSDDERSVFPRMHFDPVDSKHVYIALKNQIRRVSVAQCVKYNTLKDCRASLDPLCGWCVNSHRCSTKDECSEFSWVSIPNDSFQRQLLYFQVAEKSSRNISLHLALSLKSTGSLIFSCAFTAGSVNVCDRSDPAAVFPNCSCSFSDQLLSTRGLTVSAAVTIGDQKITEMLTLRNCSSITENSSNVSYTQCVQCISAGCHWSSSIQQCDWTHEPGPQLQVQDACKDLHSGMDYKEPEIISLEPNKVSFHGRNRVLLRGSNLESVTKIHIQGDLECIPKEAPVFERSSDTLRFNVPPSETKETVKVCAVTPDGRCHGNSIITYSSQPSCTGIQPKVTWNSGGRKIHVQGTNMELVESIILHPSRKELKIQHDTSSGDVWFLSHHNDSSAVFRLSLKFENYAVECVDNFSYLPDPEITGFTTLQVSDDLLVVIQKKADELNLSKSEVNVIGQQGDQEHECVLERIESSTILCKMKQVSGAIITLDSLTVRVGNSFVFRMGQSSTKYMFCLSPQKPSGQE
ncbi:plexin-C1-like isoform X1 [Myxocyprinus asiaticus]|uniref:plexin-C1-like isoform X1 n=1 Tax=Myxocyprinus asiaticus TaxID=70543 RepID=UPI002222EA38|nr:plexin-C1-like isoform X1 [Myxocyprinus asiaticus]